MSNAVRRVSLASIMLLLCALTSCEIGQRMWQTEIEELEKSMEAGGFYIYHAYPDTNGWQIAGGILFFVSISIAIAALMFGDRINRKAAVRSEAQSERRLQPRG